MPQLSIANATLYFPGSVAFQLLKCGIGNDEVRLFYSYLIELAG